MSEEEEEEETSPEQGASGKKRLKQAFVIIHGMGEQRPMDTLRSFVKAVWTTDEEVKWNSPRVPRVSASLITLRGVLSSGGSPPPRGGTASAPIFSSSTGRTCCRGLPWVTCSIGFAS
jgi:hypothetical protein